MYERLLSLFSDALALNARDLTDDCWYSDSEVDADVTRRFLLDARAIDFDISVFWWAPGDSPNAEANPVTRYCYVDQWLVDTVRYTVDGAEVHGSEWLPGCPF